jgi:KRAB domain-containing zinc finger protein
MICDILAAVHAMLHNDEKPYHCKVCSKTFLQKSHLMVHIYEHVGDNPFLCLECGDSFNTLAASEEAQ